MAKETFKRTKPHVNIGTIGRLFSRCPNKTFTSRSHNKVILTFLMNLNNTEVLFTTGYGCLLSEQCI